MYQTGSSFGLSRPVSAASTVPEKLSNADRGRLFVEAIVNEEEGEVDFEDDGNIARYLREA